MSKSRSFASLRMTPLRRRRVRTFTFRFVVALAALTTRPIAAQVISGVVVLPDSATPAAGVIVVATDASGRESSRALSSERGEYSLRLPSSGRYTLKVLRIGYRPTVGPIVAVTDAGKETVRIVLAAEAVSLATINIRDRETCRVNADTGLSVARVWEEARKAMLSTQLTSDAVPLFAEWVEYDQMLDSTARLVRSQRVRTSRNPTTHAFRSRPAAFLDTAGYVVSDNSGTTYFAPDAEVLLSEMFAGSHCFRLAAPPRENPNLVGVSFQPSRDRRDMREIEGTLWLDRTTAELRWLDFKFTNLHELAMTAGAGGRVEFLHLREGSWLVSRWSLRMPQLEARRAANAAFQRTLTPTRPVLRAVQITGGEVTRVLRADSLVFEATGPRVVVQVIGTDSLVPAAGATLTLEGTDYRGEANASGRVELSPVLAGRYRAQVRTSLMDSLGMPAVLAEVEARTDARVESIRLPSPRDVLVKACPRDSIANGEGMLHGIVRNERAEVVRNAAVVATWQGDVSVIGNVNADQLRYTEKSVGSISGNEGAWRICGIPRGMAVAVRVVSDSGRDLQRVRLDADFATVSLVARRGTTAATREVDAAMGRSSKPTALVEFTVINLEGAALPNVTLDVRADGGSRTIATGTGGKALLPDVAPGRLTIRARRIGFKEGLLVARVEAGHNTVPIVMSEIAPPSLDTVRVVGDRPVTGLGRHDEFDQRRLRSIGGRFVTPEEIEKQNPLRVTKILRRVPGVTLRDSSGVTIAVSGRGLKIVRMGEGPNSQLVPVPCTMRVGVDGTLKENGFDMDLLSPKDIYGVEVYTPATVPPQYNGQKADSFCGLIMIWTK